MQARKMRISDDSDSTIFPAIYKMTEQIAKKSEDREEYITHSGLRHLMSFGSYSTDICPKRDIIDERPPFPYSPDALRENFPIVNMFVKKILVNLEQDEYLNTEAKNCLDKINCMPLDPRICMPLLQCVRTSEPAVYKGILDNIETMLKIDLNQMSSSSYKKKKFHEELSPDPDNEYSSTEEKEADMDCARNSSDSPVRKNFKSLLPALDPDPLHIQALGRQATIFIAKALAKGTLHSHLIAIKLLLSTFWSIEKPNMHDQVSHECRSGKNIARLPLGALLGTLFTEEKALNPFYHFLHQAREARFRNVPEAPGNEELDISESLSGNLPAGSIGETVEQEMSMASEEAFSDLINIPGGEMTTYASESPAYSPTEPLPNQEHAPPTPEFGSAEAILLLQEFFPREFPQDSDDFYEESSHDPVRDEIADIRCLGMVAVESIVLALLAYSDQRCSRNEPPPSALASNYHFTYLLLCSILKQLSVGRKACAILASELSATGDDPINIGASILSEDKKWPRGYYAHKVWRRGLFFAAASASALRILKSNLKHLSINNNDNIFKDIIPVAASETPSQKTLASCVFASLEELMRFEWQFPVGSMSEEEGKLKKLCENLNSLVRDISVDVWTTGIPLLYPTVEELIGTLTIHIERFDSAPHEILKLSALSTKMIKSGVFVELLRSLIDIEETEKTSLWEEVKSKVKQQSLLTNILYALLRILSKFDVPPLIHLLSHIQKIMCTAIVEASDGRNRRKSNGPEFDKEMMSQNMSLLNGNRGVVQKQSKNWGSVLVREGFAPGTGIHQWAVSLDRCEKGHVFIGACTSQASVNTYVGGDRYGWGLIGTRTLWHNRTKSRSDYGSGFSTGSVVYVTYDSDCGVLSFAGAAGNDCDGGEWGIAFDDIPHNETIYPAIGLYQRDDQVSIFAYSSQKLKQVSNRSEGGLSFNPSIYGLQTAAQFNFFLRFTKEIMTVACKKLEASVKNGTTDSIHPILSNFLPRLLSALLLISPRYQIEGFLAVQCLPTLSKMVHLCNSIVSKEDKNILKESTELNVTGEWQIISNASGTIAAQNYSLIFQKDGADSSCSSTAYGLVGEGSSKDTSVAIKGTVVGYRILFTEMWQNSGSCVVDARLSIDGMFFDGIYFDKVSGTKGDIMGFRKGNPGNEFNTSVLFKYNMLNLLLASTAGKYSGIFISGLPAKLVQSSIASNSNEHPEELLSYIESMNDVNNNDFSAGYRGETLGAESIKSAAEEMDVEKLTVHESISESMVLEFSKDIDSNRPQFNIPELYQLVIEWQNSPLFSGGLTNGEIQRHLSSTITCYSPAKFYTNVDQAWLSSAFGYNVMDPATSESSLDQFYVDIISNTPDQAALGMEIDSWVTLHITKSFFLRIGGDSMEKSRRYVLAALILHSNSLPAILASWGERAASASPLSHPPSVKIRELWSKASQVIESGIRYAKATGADMAAIASALQQKAEFLLNVQPSFWFFDGDKQQKSITATVSFLQSPLQDTASLRATLLRASVLAAFRAAGLYSLVDIIRGPPMTKKLNNKAVLSLLQQVSPTLQGRHANKQVDIFYTSKSVATQSSSVGCHAKGLEGASAGLRTQVLNTFMSLSRELITKLKRAAEMGDPESIILLLQTLTAELCRADQAFLSESNFCGVLQKCVDCVLSSEYMIGPSNDAGTFAEYLRLERTHRITLAILDTLNLFVMQVLSQAPPEGDVALDAFANRDGMFDIVHKLLCSFSDESKEHSKTVFGVDVKSVLEATSLSEEKMPCYREYCNSALRVLWISCNMDYCVQVLASAKWLTLLMQMLLHRSDTSDKQRLVLRLLKIIMPRVDPNEIRLDCFEIKAGKFVADSSDTAPSIGPSFVSVMLDFLGSLLVPSCLSAVLSSDNATVKSELLSTSAPNQATQQKKPQKNSVDSKVLGRTFGNSVAAETVVLLRGLFTHSHWRDILSDQLIQSLNQAKEILNVSPSDSTRKSYVELLKNSEDIMLMKTSSFYSATAAVSVLGGYLVEFFIEGAVLLNVKATNEHYSSRLSTPGYGVVKSIDLAKETAQVKLIERSPQNSRGSWKVGESASIKTMHQVKIPLHDLTPVLEEEAPFELFQKPLATCLMDTLMEDCLTWLRLLGESGTVRLDGKSADSNTSNSTQEQVVEKESEDGSEAVESPQLTDEKMTSDEIIDCINYCEINSLQSLLAAQLFRSVDAMLTCPLWTSYFFYDSDEFSTKRLLTLLEVAVEAPAQNIPLGKLREKVRSLTKMWSKWHLDHEILGQKITAPITSGSPPATPTPAIDTGKDKEDRFLQSMRMEREREESSMNISSNSLADYISATAAALGAGTVVLDTTAAVAQLMEMGFPKEWCEVALRRCGNSLELAVNFCFEHAADMPRLIEQETNAMRAAEQRRAGLLRRVQNVTESGSSRQMSDSTSQFMRQLLEMGFPPGWCSRALAANRNNVDAALTWILSNGTGMEQETSEETENHSHQAESQPSVVKPSIKKSEDEETNTQINPLRLVSGQAKISNELKVEGVPSGGFASVGVRGCPVSKGKWYYEAALGTGGCMQLGWADVGYQGNADSGDGVGDGPHSWAYDGWRCYRWHGKYAQWGTRWAAGDYVGCWADLDSDGNYKLGFHLNGSSEEVGMGLAFSSVIFCGGIYPCASFNKQEKLTFNFGGKPFKYPPPPGFRPFIEAVEERMDFFQKIRTLCNIDDGKIDALYTEDNLEEELGEGNFLPSTRYFASDSSSGGAVSTLSDENSENNDWKHSTYRYPALRRLRMLQRNSPHPDRDAVATNASLAATAADTSSLEAAKASEKSEPSENPNPCSPTEADLEVVNSSRQNIAQCAIEMCTLLVRRIVGLILARWPRTASSRFSLKKLVSSSAATNSLQLKMDYENASHLLIDLFQLLSASSQNDAEAITLGSISWSGVSSNFCDFDEKCPSIRQAVSSLGVGGIHALKLLEPSISSALSEASNAADKDSIELIFSLSLLSFIGNQIIEAVHLSRTSVCTASDSVRRIPISAQSNVVDDIWNSLTDKPNMTLIIWITSRLLADSKIAMLPCNPFENLAGIIVSRLLYFWCQALYSPSMSMKLLGAGMISTIMRDMFAEKWEGSRKAITESFATLPLDRLQQLTITRIWAERGSHPICSRYLQGLVDLTCTIHLIRPSDETSEDDTKDLKCQQQTLPRCLPNQSKETSSAPTFCLEWDRGTILSDHSWTVFSGTIRQEEFDWPKPKRNSRSLESESVGDEAPRFLKPGYHVIKGPDWDENLYIEPMPSAESVAQAQAAATSAQSFKKPVPPPPPLPAKGKPGKGPKLWSRVRGVPRTISISDMDEDVIAAMATMAAMESEDNDSLRNDSDGAAADDRDRERDYQDAAERLENSYFVDFDECGSSTDEEGINEEMEESVKEASEEKAEEEPTECSKSSRTSPAPPVSPPAIGIVEEIIDWDGFPGQGRRVRWPDGSIGNYRWGANGRLDLVHVDLNPDGSIKSRHSLPETREDAAIAAGLGKELLYGVILRIRPNPVDDGKKNGNGSEKVEGVLEWPDLDAAVRVSGFKDGNGRYVLTEKEILWGSQDAGWLCRFGTHEWQPNTKFTLTTTTRKNKSMMKLNGECVYDVTIGGKTCQVKCQVNLQTELLFVLDNQRCAPNIVITEEGRTAKCESNDGRCAVYGNVGFSQGIHYWEVKIMCAEPGCVFLGVAEAPSKGRVTDSRLARWPGKGFVNYRAIFYGGTERVYGEHFHTNDVVGVLLDMDRGTLSFFLDGMKYGEHVVVQLGVAFDGLHGQRPRVVPKVLYPIIGFRKKNDRISLTSKWISSPGLHPTVPLSSAKKTTEALNYWENRQITGTAPSPSLNQNIPRWLLLESWQHCRRWRSNRWKRVTTRAGTNICVDLDCSPSSCLIASMNLGLVFPIFTGDTVKVHHSNGRALESPETLTVLGAYMGRLWWRRADGLKGGGSGVGESIGEAGASVIWCWSPGDIDSDEVETIRTSPISPNMARSVPLSKMCLYDDMMLEVCNINGIQLYRTSELNASEILCSLPSKTLLKPECIRVSASEDILYMISHNDLRGWISEQNAESGLLDVKQCTVSGSDYDVAPFPTGCSDAVIQATVETWENFIVTAGGYEGKLWLQNEDVLDMEGDFDEDVQNISFEQFLQNATSRDWTVEEDMLLSELLNDICDRLGEEQINLPWYEVKSKLSCDDASSANQSILEIYKAIADIPSLQIMARMSMIRTFNMHVQSALPMLRLTLPEEDWWQRATSSNAKLPLSCDPSESRAMGTKDVCRSWRPTCLVRNLRHLRRLLLTETKRSFWENIIAATTTPTPLPHDEYEDPREVRLVRLNRIQAAPTRLTQIRNPLERLRHSIFGQLQRELRSWQASYLRRSFVGKGQGGQKRAFRVKFLGEGVNDYGGPYRAVFEQMAEELQADQVNGTNSCLLPLLVPVPNRKEKIGMNQDKFTLHPSFGDSHDLMCFLGRIIGTSVRHGLQMGLDFPSTIWKPLVGLPLRLKNLEEIDVLTAKRVMQINKQGEMLSADESESLPEVWSEITLTKYLSDGRLVELVPGGFSQTLSRTNWRTYTSRTVAAGLYEGGPALNALFAGMASVLPSELLPLFTAEELESMISGSSDVDVDRLEEVVEYEDVRWSDPHIQNFWKVLRLDFTPAERSAFLRFVWARSRLPRSMRDLPMSFKIQPFAMAANKNPDDFLPHAQTCFFSLSLPAYSSREVLRSKLRYAISHCPTMDADVRLHNAEGW